MPATISGSARKRHRERQPQPQRIEAELVGRSRRTRRTGCRRLWLAWCGCVVIGHRSAPQLVLSGALQRPCQTASQGVAACARRGRIALSASVGALRHRLVRLHHAGPADWRWLAAWLRHARAMPLFPPASCPRLIVKVGSALLVDARWQVRRDWLAGLVADIAERHAAGQQVAIVSSGAIALGARRLGLAKGGRASLEDAQAAAATGQIALARSGPNRSARRADRRADAGHARRSRGSPPLPERRRDARPAARPGRRAGHQRERQRRHRRDPLRRQRPARRARRAGRGRAGRRPAVRRRRPLRSQPRRPRRACTSPRVERIDAAIEAMADGGSASGMGSGGMASKLAAARIATQAGIALAIANGRVDRPLAGERAAHAVRARAAARPRARRGSRAGVARARHDPRRCRRRPRRSPAAPACSRRARRGSRAVSTRGDLVRIVGPDGALARGLSEYDSADAARLLGRRSRRTCRAARLRPARGAGPPQSHGAAVILALTGATGFVGRPAARSRRSRAGHQVRALTRRPQPPRDGVTWIAGDLARSRRARARGADAVVHVAGVVNAPDRAGFAAGNIDGTRGDPRGRAGGRRRRASSMSPRSPRASRACRNYGWSKARGGARWSRPAIATGPSSARPRSMAPATSRCATCSAWRSCGLALMPPPGRHVGDPCRRPRAAVAGAGGHARRPRILRARWTGRRR